MDDLIDGKVTVENFLRLAWERGRAEEAVQRFMGDQYIQHSPTAEDGKDGFIKYASALAKERPGRLKLDIRRILAEGDLVVVHMWVTGLTDRGPGYAVVDIFRLDGDGRIVEHWDVMQEIPGNTLPERMF